MDPSGIALAPGLMLLAWSIEATFGWPEALFTRIRHPVVWIGWLVEGCEPLGNDRNKSHAFRYVAGAVATIGIVGATAGTAWLISAAMPQNAFGFIVTALVTSSLLASRSLYTHVNVISAPLMGNDLPGARFAVGQIVGRQTATLDEQGVVRAALESLAENTSDGVTAPLFWGALLGVPGIVAYKAINTMDSMIGHKNDQYSAFGGFAARLDDVVNYIPARLTGALFVLASLNPNAAKTMLRDGKSHRSLNAGWPEAAMAGALDVRLSGPRRYGDTVANDAWLNAGAPDPDATHLKRGLSIYLRSLTILACLLLFLTLLVLL